MSRQSVSSPSMGGGLAGGQTRVLTLALPADTSAALKARAFVRACSDDVVPDPEVLDTLTLLTSEVVTNAVLHGGGPIELRFTPQDNGGARVEVEDGSPALPQPRQYEADATTGRGLGMVAALASAWGVTNGVGGKTVWFEVGGAHAAETSAVSSDEPTDAALQPRPIGILGLPIDLYLKTQAHNDELIREFGFIAQQGAERGGVPARLLELVELVGELFAAPAAESRAQVQAAVARGDETVDLRLVMAPAAAPFTQQLCELLDEADEYCREGNLLTLESSPEVRLFRWWFLQQVLDQIEGRPPTPWRNRRRPLP